MPEHAPLTRVEQILAALAAQATIGNERAPSLSCDWDQGMSPDAWRRGGGS